MIESSLKISYESETKLWNLQQRLFTACRPQRFVLIFPFCSKPYSVLMNVEPAIQTLSIHMGPRKLKWSHWRSFAPGNLSFFCFFLERISKTIWRLWTLSPSIGRVQLLSLFFFLLLLFWLLTLLSLRECNAVGMVIKCCVAGFRLFVYSSASIILNKTSLGDSPSQLGHDCATRQPRRRRHILAFE